MCQSFLLINQQKVLMKVQNKNTKGITLKQYINTTNIRRQVISRTKSKDKLKQRQSLNTTKIAHPKQVRDGYLHLTRQLLCEEIKLKIAEFIPSNSNLVPLLNMIDRLIELFTIQIKQQAKQNQITTQMLKDCSRLQIRSSKPENRLETKRSQSQNKFPQYNRNHVTQYTKKDRLDQSLLQIDDSRVRSESCSSMDIPNINLLLISNKQSYPHLQYQQQTKATLNNQNVSFRTSNRNEIQFFQKLQYDEKKKKCLIGSNANQIHSYPQSVRVSCSNSEVKFSKFGKIQAKLKMAQPNFRSIKQRRG